MKTIESKIKRDGGTHVEFGSTKYHFKPDATGAHVAQVEDEHAERLLGIPEGYRLAAKAAAPKKPEAPDAPNGAQVLQGNGGSGEAGSAGAIQPPAKPNQETPPDAKPKAAVKAKRAAAPRKTARKAQ